MFGKNRPVIGVTGPEKGGRGAWLCTAFSIRLAGGIPKRITPGHSIPINKLDGLILGGGADIEPEKYGEQRLEKSVLDKDKRSIFEWILSFIFFPVYWVFRYFQHTKQNPVDLKRDRLEFDLLRKAIEQEKPVLGICRGMQLINVHFGGTLHQDIAGYYAERPKISTILPRKRITIEENSKLAKMLQTSLCNVNALHNQAIDRLGNGLKKTARELHSVIIQGIEHPEYPFVIGVQWHPEYLIQIARQRNIFKELVKAASTPKIYSTKWIA